MEIRLSHRILSYGSKVMDGYVHIVMDNSFRFRNTAPLHGQEG